MAHCQYTSPTLGFRVPAYLMGTTEFAGAQQSKYLATQSTCLIAVNDFYLSHGQCADSFLFLFRPSLQAG